MGPDEEPFVPKGKRQRSDEFTRIAKLAAKMGIQLASRLRSLESAVYSTWHGPMGQGISKAMAEVGKATDQTFKKAKASGKKFQ